MNAQRQAAETAKARPLEERKARVAEIAKIASEKAKRGLANIDFREPTEKERAHAETISERVKARRAGERSRKTA